MFAGIRQAIMVASIKIVPEPHIGSIKFSSPVYPESNTNPAAKTSLIGAIFVELLYPLLCKESPELSKETVQKSSFI